MSAIDGEMVYYTTETDWHGTVLGDATSPGLVRVHWDCPTSFIGVHNPRDLTVYEIPDEVVVELIRRQSRQLELLRSFMVKMPVDVKTQLMVHGKLEECQRIAKGLDIDVEV